VLDAFLQHHHDQGLSPRLVRAEELFHASTHETVKV
jgi:4,5-dihydroxyphthalate decarboxylase